MSGFAGAGHIAALLQSRGIRVDYLLDEGTPVLDVGNAPFLEKQVAFVGK